MIIVGLTGGIGSGKTTVAKAFKNLGVPVYIADVEAKKLMRTSKVIKAELTELFGEQAYLDNTLNKPFIADTIFNDKSYLERMNAIVHPRVAEHFKDWVNKQNTPYVIKEVAILFENGGHTACDYVITVTAPKALRIKRLLKRSQTTEKQIEAIMKNQWNDKDRIAKSHFVIENIILEDAVNQVSIIHEEIIKKTR